MCKVVEGRYVHYPLSDGTLSPLHPVLCAQQGQNQPWESTGPSCCRNTAAPPSDPECHLGLTHSPVLHQGAELNRNYNVRAAAHAMGYPKQKGSQPHDTNRLATQQSALFSFRPPQRRQRERRSHDSQRSLSRLDASRACALPVNGRGVGRCVRDREQALQYDHTAASCCLGESADGRWEKKGARVKVGGCGGE